MIITALILFAACMIFAIPCMIAGAILGRVAKWATAKPR